MNTKLMGIVLVAFLFVMGCSSTKNADVGVAGQDMMVPAPENANVQETIVSDTQIEDGSVDGQPAKPPVEMIRQEGTLSGSDAPVKELRITAYNFGFDVEPITINKGDTVKVIVTSREGTHGITQGAHYGNHRAGWIVPGRAPAFQGLRGAWHHPSSLDLQHQPH